MSVVLVALRLGLAVVFGIAGAAKLADRTGFQRALGGFGLPAASAKPVAVALPLAELAVALALVLPATAWWAAGAAALLLIGFIAVIGRSLARGQTPECKCFGRLSAGQVGRRTIVRNGVFTLAAAGLVGAGPARLAPSAVGWFGGLSAAQQIGLVSGLVTAGLLVVQGWLLIQLTRQNGRLLMRVTSLEHRVNSAAGGRSQLPVVPAQHGTNGHAHGGLAIGGPAPTVRLPDLDGNLVDLADFRGEPTLVLFWSPSCGFCQRMLPDLRAWEARRTDASPRLLIVSTGSAADNRAQGLAAPVLLDEDFATGHAFGASGTPQAVLVDAAGSVASGRVAGAQAVLRLADTVPSPV